MSADILMYIQIFILVKAVFFLWGNQRSSLIIKTPEETKQGKYYDENKEKKLVIIASSCRTRY